MATTITTYVTRTKVDLENPTTEMIDLRDIAHALARLNRFTGHTARPYTVAEHCVVGYNLIPRAFALEWMLHDAPEAYLGDVSGPLKSIIGPKYKELEQKFESVIATKFGLVPEAHPLVKQIDAEMLQVEQALIAHGSDSTANKGRRVGYEKIWELLENRHGDDKSQFLYICHTLIEEKYLSFRRTYDANGRAGT